MIEYSFFFLFGCLVLFLAFKVVSTQNPVYSVLYLVLTFVLSSVFVLILGLDFIALFFVLVYVGAIAVLFLFVVMMLDIKLVERPISSFFPVLSLLFIATILSHGGFPSLWEIKSWFIYLFLPFYTKIALYLGIDFGLSEIINLSRLTDFFLFVDFTSIDCDSTWLKTLDFSTSIKNLGHVLYTYHLVLFLLGGIVLLIAMIGAIALSLQPNKTESLSRQLSRQPKNAIFLTKEYKVLTFRDLEVIPTGKNSFI
ncbi:unnamed protein product [Discosporangium mesarthrocarpum]